MAEFCEVVSAGICYRGLVHSKGASFLGIPYADPPVGPRRFMPPRPISRVPQSVDATKPDLAAPQAQRPMPDWAPRSTGFETSEDCLNLNLFAPGADDARRPVIVHVFGGGFQTGSANGGYQDDIGFACDGDVVLVRPNMRVGALGFLHIAPVMGETSGPANRGLLDLVEALRWVNRNISAFGGDPGNVTLLGLSCGAFTAASVLGMDDVEGLFRRLWLMSGSARRIVEAGTATAMAEDFLDMAGVAPGDTNALQALPVETILDIQERIVATNLGVRNAPGGRTFGIVADGTSLVRHPLDALASGSWRDIDILCGWTRDEARIWYELGVMQPPQDFASVAATVRLFHGDAAPEILSALRSEAPDATPREVEERFLSRVIYSDAALRTLKAHASTGGRAYAYEFGWVPRGKWSRFGAAHAFDEPFVFGKVEPERIPFAAGDLGAADLAQRLNHAVIRFARTGDPGWPDWSDQAPVHEFF